MKGCVAESGLYLDEIVICTDSDEWRIVGNDSSIIGLVVGSKPRQEQGRQIRLPRR